MILRTGLIYIRKADLYESISLQAHQNFIRHLKQKITTHIIEQKAICFADETTILPAVYNNQTPRCKTYSASATA